MCLGVNADRETQRKERCGQGSPESGVSGCTQSAGRGVDEDQSEGTYSSLSSLDDSLSEDSSSLREGRDRGGRAVSWRVAKAQGKDAGQRRRAKNAPQRARTFPVIDCPLRTWRAPRRTPRAPFPRASSARGGAVAALPRQRQRRPSPSPSPTQSRPRRDRGAKRVPQAILAAMRSQTPCGRGSDACAAPWTPARASAREPARQG